ncbi:hypothetical protein SNEBB_009683 [Seison nebaliae]|nr:hypothetical protein SNEBB_009683 [Seison nebaliae]
MTKLKHQNLRCVALIVIMGTYLLVGAAIFDALESPNEERIRNENSLIKLQIRKKYNLTKEEMNEVDQVVRDKLKIRAGLQWNFAGSFYFCTVVLALIGYGHSTPKTRGGRAACMIYAFIGIPLTVIMFQSAGERINMVITWIVKRAKVFFRRRRIYCQYCNEKVLKCAIYRHIRYTQLIFHEEEETDQNANKENLSENIERRKSIESIIQTEINYCEDCSDRKISNCQKEKMENIIHRKDRTKEISTKSFLINEKKMDKKGRQKQSKLIEQRIQLTGRICCVCRKLKEQYIEEFTNDVEIQQSVKFEKTSRILYKLKQNKVLDEEVILNNSDELKVSEYEILLADSFLATLTVLLGSAVFSWKEKWTYIDSVYYTMMTFTTIGFGDYVALQKPNMLTEQPGYVAFTITFILFGLTVYASSYNLLVLKIVEINADYEKKERLRLAEVQRQAVTLHGDVICAGKNLKGDEKPDYSVGADQLSICSLTPCCFEMRHVSADIKSAITGDYHIDGEYYHTGPCSFCCDTTLCCWKMNNCTKCFQCNSNESEDITRNFYFHDTNRSIEDNSENYSQTKFVDDHIDLSVCRQQSIDSEVQLKNISLEQKLKLLSQTDLQKEAEKKNINNIDSTQNQSPIVQQSIETEKDAIFDQSIKQRRRRVESSLKTIERISSKILKHKRRRSCTDISVMRGWDKKQIDQISQCRSDDVLFVKKKNIGNYLPTIFKMTIDDLKKPIITKNMTLRCKWQIIQQKQIIKNKSEQKCPWLKTFRQLAEQDKIHFERSPNLLKPFQTTNSLIISNKQNVPANLLLPTPNVGSQREKLMTTLAAAKTAKKWLTHFRDDYEGKPGENEQDVRIFAKAAPGMSAPKQRLNRRALEIQKKHMAKLEEAAERQKRSTFAKTKYKASVFSKMGLSDDQSNDHGMNNMENKSSIITMPSMKKSKKNSRVSEINEMLKQLPDINRNPRILTLYHMKEKQLNPNVLIDTEDLITCIDMQKTFNVNAAITCMSRYQYTPLFDHPLLDNYSQTYRLLRERLERQMIEGKLDIEKKIYFPMFVYMIPGENDVTNDQVIIRRSSSL